MKTSQTGSFFLFLNFYALANVPRETCFMKNKKR